MLAARHDVRSIPLKLCKLLFVYKMNSADKRTQPHLISDSWFYSIEVNKSNPLDSLSLARSRGKVVIVIHAHRGRRGLIRIH
uniref:Uncharacterized protein n=1 Tax=Romanomermis culicivorax TaxID=13658 RepID=A0A915KKV9_ROMCU